MARSPLPYMTKSDLARRLAVEQAKYVTASGGERTNIRDVEAELAEYCGVSRETISMIKRNRNQASLPVAMKICEWLGCAVEDVFQLVPNPKYKG